MTDPTFTTQAELLAWTRQRSANMVCAHPLAQLRALEDIKRVTLAHGHLMERD